MRVALAAPLLLLALLTTLALLVHRRVLRPLKLLHQATAAVASGDMQVRVGLSRNDEIGEVARRFDAMTAQLALRSEQLRRSEKQMRAVTDNIPALIAYVGRDGLFRYANAHYRTVYGVEPEQMIGRSIAQTLGLETARRVQPQFDAALAGQRQTFERHANEHGIDRYVQAENIPDIEADGTVSGIYVMVFDITARKRAELAQERSEERVRSILTQAPDAFVSLDREGRISEWNRRAEVVFGWRRDEVLGRPLADVLIPPAQRHAHNAGFAHFMVSGQGVVVNRRVELQALHMNGGEIPIELSVSAVKEEGAWMANAFLRDISERKQAEQALRAGEQRLRSLTDNLPAMVGYFDRDERCLYANELAMKIQGVKPEDLSSQTFRSGIGDDAYALHAEHVQAVLGGKRRYFEGQLRRGTRDVFFQAHLVPALDVVGAVQGFYAMTFDVTPVRRAQLAQQRSEERLRQIADNLPVLICYVNSEQRYEFANATYRE